jgi:hypothetical protein
VLSLHLILCGRFVGVAVSVVALFTDPLVEVPFVLCCVVGNDSIIQNCT